MKQCILVVAVCVSVCLFLAAFPHHCTDPDVGWGNGRGALYTLNHKKRDILFLTITFANLNRFLWFLYHFNRAEILHSTVVKICHITRFMCTAYLEKLKPTFWP